MRSFVLAWAAVFLVSGTAASQEAEPRRWAAGLSFTGERFEAATPSWEDWSAVEARLERRFTGGTVALEGGWFERFGHDDRLAGVDLYLVLWPGAYGNAHLRVAPDAAAIARTDLMLELFQGFASGWEPSLGYRYSRYADGSVHAGSVAAARYFGAWYGRARLAHARRSGTGGTSFGALLRRTLGSEAEVAEATFSTGTEAVTVPGVDSAPDVELRGTTSATVGARVQLSGPLGLALALGYTTFEGAPARGSAGAALTLRW